MNDSRVPFPPSCSVVFSYTCALLARFEFRKVISFSTYLFLLAYVLDYILP